MPTTAPTEDGGESDASGDTVDLDSQKLDSLEVESPESFLPDHIQLSNAAFASSGDLHKLLAKHNIDIDSRDQAGYTTLMTMITHKRRDSALVLLKHGAGVLLVNSQGWSAFHLAASTGDIEVLQALVAAARRASDTALAEALVSEPVDRRTAPACPPAAAPSARFGHSSNRRRARARERRLRGSRRTRRARPTSSSSPLPPTLRRPEAPRPRPLPLPSPTLRPQRSPLPPPPHRHSRRRRRRRRPRRQLRGRHRRQWRRHRPRAALTQSR